MAALIFEALKPSGSIVLNNGASLYFSGPNFSDDVALNSYQSSTHVSFGETEDPVCNNTEGHINNTKYLTSSTLSLNGASSSNLSALTTGQCTLKLTFTADSAISIKDAKLWAYFGEDLTAIPGVNIWGYQQGHGTTWTNLNGGGPGAVLSLADITTPATSQYYYVAISMNATAKESKSLQLKVALTYY